jgi:transposase
MGMRLRVFLSEAADRALQEMRRQKDIPQRVKERADVVRMNARGDYVEEIAAYFDWHVKTVRRTLQQWQSKGIEGLWEADGRGRKARWQEADLVHLETALLEEERTYTSSQLAEKLEIERGVKLSSGQIRRVLKKRGSSGSAPATLISNGKTPNNGLSNKRT